MFILLAVDKKKITSYNAELELVCVHVYLFYMEIRVFLNFILTYVNWWTSFEMPCWQCRRTDSTEGEWSPLYQPYKDLWESVQRSSIQNKNLFFKCADNFVAIQTRVDANSEFYPSVSKNCKLFVLHQGQEVQSKCRDFSGMFVFVPIWQTWKNWNRTKFDRNLIIKRWYCQ